MSISQICCMQGICWLRVRWSYYVNTLAIVHLIAACVTLQASYTPAGIFCMLVNKATPDSR